MEEVRQSPFYQEAFMPEKQLDFSDEELYFESESSHPHLRTLPEEELGEPWYWVIEIGYAWIAGFRPYKYWYNTTNCFDRWTNYTFHEIPTYKSRVKAWRYTAYDKLDMTTVLIQNTTVHLWYCNSAWTSMNRYWVKRINEYNGKVGTFFLSMLQNALAQVISFTNLYYSMRDNIRAKNATGINYDAARITRMLIIFDPIEPVDEDLDRILIPNADNDLYDPNVNTIGD
jgi:hypothetical protein